MWRKELRLVGLFEHYSPNPKPTVIHRTLLIASNEDPFGFYHTDQSSNFCHRLLEVELSLAEPLGFSRPKPARNDRTSDSECCSIAEGLRFSVSDAFGFGYPVVMG